MWSDPPDRPSASGRRDRRGAAGAAFAPVSSHPAAGRGRATARTADVRFASQYLAAMNHPRSRCAGRALSKLNSRAARRASGTAGSSTADRGQPARRARATPSPSRPDAVRAADRVLQAARHDDDEARPQRRTVTLGRRGKVDRGRPPDYATPPAVLRLTRKARQRSPTAPRRRGVTPSRARQVRDGIAALSAHRRSGALGRPNAIERSCRRAR